MASRSSSASASIFTAPRRHQCAPQNATPGVQEKASRPPRRTSGGPIRSVGKRSSLAAAISRHQGNGITRSPLTARQSAGVTKFPGTSHRVAVLSYGVDLITIHRSCSTGLRSALSDRRPTVCFAIRWYLRLSCVWCVLALRSPTSHIPQPSTLYLPPTDPASGH